MLWKVFYHLKWEIKKIPFNNDITNIEDRLWGKEIIKKGYNIVYIPEASVYHYHGINHNLSSDRARNVVKILESLDTTKTNRGNLKSQDLKIAALIPIKGKTNKINSKSLLEIAINSARESKCINEIIVSTDEDETIKLANELGVSISLKRPSKLSNFIFFS